jgi:hypothetical protein
VREIKREEERDREIEREKERDREIEIKRRKLILTKGRGKQWKQIGATWIEKDRKKDS